MDKKLFYIKLVHTIIWLFFVVVIFYIPLYSDCLYCDILLIVRKSMKSSLLKRIAVCAFLAILTFLTGRGITCFAVNNSEISWQRLTLDVDGVYAVACNENRFVAVGAGGEIRTSEEGADWKKQKSGVSANLHSVIWKDKYFAAFGEDSTILTSADGMRWNKVNPEGLPPYTQIYKALPQNDKIMICTSRGVYFSYDLANWQGIDYLSYDGSNSLMDVRSIATNLSRYVEVVDYRLRVASPFSSGYDIVEFPVNCMFNEVEWNGYRFLAWGVDIREGHRPSGMAYPIYHFYLAESSDGSKWSINEVSGQQAMSFGEGFSSDFKPDVEWMIAENGRTENFKRAAWNGKKFVAVIARSPGYDICGGPVMSGTAFDASASDDEDKAAYYLELSTGGKTIQSGIKAYWHKDAESDYILALGQDDYLYLFSKADLSYRRISSNRIKNKTHCYIGFLNGKYYYCENGVLMCTDGKNEAYAGNNYYLFSATAGFKTTDNKIFYARESCDFENWKRFYVLDTRTNTESEISDQWVQLLYLSDELYVFSYDSFDYKTGSGTLTVYFTTKDGTEKVFERESHNSRLGCEDLGSLVKLSPDVLIFGELKPFGSNFIFTDFYSGIYLLSPSNTTLTKVLDIRYISDILPKNNRLYVLSARGPGNEGGGPRPYFDGGQGNEIGYYDLASHKYTKIVDANSTNAVGDIESIDAVDDEGNIYYTSSSGVGMQHFDVTRFKFYVKDLKLEVLSFTPGRIENDPRIMEEEYYISDISKKIHKYRIRGLLRGGIIG